jgi:thioredoxin 1
MDLAPPQETPVSEKVLHAGDSDFDATVLQSSEPVLVDFWAPWCGPCKAIGPIVEQLADQYQGKAKVVKVDVQEFPSLGVRYNVRSIPMLLMFKDGQVHSSQLGAPPNIKSLLTQMIDKAI